MNVKYYSLQRPISSGTYPQKAVILEMKNFEQREYIPAIERWACGYMICEKPLYNWDCEAYNLEPEPCVTLEFRFVGIDSHYRYTYLD